MELTIILQLCKQFEANLTSAFNSPLPVTLLKFDVGQNGDPGWGSSEKKRSQLRLKNIEREAQGRKISGKNMRKS